MDSLDHDPDTQSSVAVYVHWPWCAALCPYCDFVKQASDFGLAEEYIEALLRHMEVTPPRRTHSLYLGGGTPSLLRPDRLERLITAWRAHFEVSADAEVTLEANPSDIVLHKVAAYLRAGVNRMSLGVQSLIDHELRLLGRRHDADKALRAAEAIRAAGCWNLSMDLMYGLPEQSERDLRRSVDGLMALQPAHVSCYALTLEPETPMGADVAAGRIVLPDDDRVADQYALLQETLSEAGYRQYEISNWARPGCESTHNLSYWRNGEYVGLGVGAAGSFSGFRYRRTPGVRDYVQFALTGQDGYVELEPWTKASRMRDTLMLGLRLAEGVSGAEFQAQFAISLTAYCTPQLRPLVEGGVVCWKGDRLALAPAHYFVCNAVLGEILPEDSYS